MIQGCMRGIPEATVIILMAEERAELEGLARSTKTEHRLRQRARIVLLAADGVASRAIGRAVGCTTGTASKWRVRYAEKRLAGLDETGERGAEPKYTTATNKRILALLDQTPPEGYARWTGPLLAAALDDVDVQYVWRFLIMAVAGQCPAVRELEIALCPLQRLDRGLLVNADDDGVLGRCHVEPDHVGGFGDERGIVALAPGFAPGEVDLLRAQETPDILDVDIVERGRQQRPCPARITLRRRLIQQRQDALVRRGRVLRLSAPLARFVETRKPLLGVTHPPLRRRAGCTSNR